MKRAVLFILLFSSITTVTFSLEAKTLTLGYKFLAPVPGAVDVNPSSMISIRYGEELGEIPGREMFIIKGSINGAYDGIVKLALDQKTIVFIPDKPFEFNETVTVMFKGGLKTTSGCNLPVLSYQFEVESRRLQSIEREYFQRINIKSFTHFQQKEHLGNDLHAETGISLGSNVVNELDEVSVPPDYFDYMIETAIEEHDGYFYLDPAAVDPDAWVMYSMPMIMDYEGNIKFFIKAGTEEWYWDLCPHPELELITYAVKGAGTNKFRVMDNTYTVIDSIVPGNGYILDSHELILELDGSIWVLGEDSRIIDMSELIEGGDPDAFVIGKVIQEMDAERNVIFEWRSLDHQDEIPITDADTVNGYIDLTNETIDYIHTNSIEIDDDGNVLISSRHINEITKIDYETGDVIWRFGGGTGNQFEFVNDEDDPAFQHQHDVHRLENGNLLLFDNGTQHDQHTLVKEYELDEENLTATLVWSFHQTPYTFSNAQGGTERLSNDNTLIGWGAQKNHLVFATEVSPENDIIWQIWMDVFRETGRIPNSYRVHKSEFIGYAARPYLCYEMAGSDVVLYMNYFGHEEEIEEFLIYLGQNENELEFYDTSINGVFTVYGLLEGQQYFLKIKASDSGGIESDWSNMIVLTPLNSIFPKRKITLPKDFSIKQLWPNPFNSEFNLVVDVLLKRDISISIYDILGRKVKNIHRGTLIPGSYHYSINGDSMSSGVYWIKLDVSGLATEIQQAVLIK